MAVLVETGCRKEGDGEFEEGKEETHLLSYNFYSED